MACSKTCPCGDSVLTARAGRRSIRQALPSDRVWLRPTTKRLAHVPLPVGVLSGTPRERGSGRPEKGTTLAKALHFSKVCRAHPFTRGYAPLMRGSAPLGRYERKKHFSSAFFYTRPYLPPAPAMGTLFRRLSRRFAHRSLGRLSSPHHLPASRLPSSFDPYSDAWMRCLRVWASGHSFQPILPPKPKR